MGQTKANNSLINKRTLADVVRVLISNVLKLLSGVLVGFLLPKILNVADYGLYRVFTLYAGYVGIFALGINDGLYLKYGGMDYEELDKQEFRLYAKSFFLIELIFAILVSVLAVPFVSTEYGFIFLCLAFYMLGNNISSYFQTISQITSRFREYSVRNIIYSVITALSIVSLWVIYRFRGTALSYKCYSIISTCILAALSFWYIFTYRKIVFGASPSLKKEWKLVAKIALLGLPLMLANMCSSLILSLDRQFVSILFDTETYAVYAFAYSMLNMATVAMTAISTVLYPTLKKNSDTTVINNFSNLLSGISVTVCFCLVAYFPLCAFIKWFLPNYVGSLPIFRIILPGLITSSCVTILMHNYYKRDGKELEFFLKCIVILVLSAIANFIAYSCFKSTESISIASVIVIWIWYAVMIERFARESHVKWIKNTLFVLLVSSCFYLITLCEIWWLSMLIYLCSLLLLLFVFFFREITVLKRKVFNKIKNRQNI